VYHSVADEFHDSVAAIFCTVSWTIGTHVTTDYDFTRPFAQPVQQLFLRVIPEGEYSRLKKILAVMVKCRLAY